MSKIPVSDGTSGPRANPALIHIRRASLDDAPGLTALIAVSARGLGQPDYSSEQIEAALEGAWGLDTELIRDGTYFAVESDRQIVACGGWSRRRTLFGGDQHAARQSQLLDPTMDAARIRAFFVRPEWARRGIGMALLERCELEAAESGFGRVELMATLPGQRLYQAAGYTANDPVEHPLGQGIFITFVPMQKVLRRVAAPDG